MRNVNIRIRRFSTKFGIRNGFIDYEDSNINLRNDDTDP